MATVTDDHPTRTRSQNSPPRRDSRLDMWRSSWRVSLRMATRDVRAHKGRSALVFIMVAIPVAVLCALAVFADTSQASPARMAHHTLGSAQANVQLPQDKQVDQGPDGFSTGFSDDTPDSTPIPGYDADADPATLGPDNADAIAALTGGTVIPEGSSGARIQLGDRNRDVEVMVLDAARGFGDKARLDSGRWAQSAGEVVVTPLGVDHGLPTSGTITASAGDAETTLTVVGVATAYTAYGGMPDLVAAQPFDGLDMSWSWMVSGDPVPWSQVRDLNTYGLTVTSAEVFRDPPAQSELGPIAQQRTDYASQDLQLLTAVGGVMLLTITVLMIAPAFAVSASRQRRALALAASNGAETRQLRRSVLAQAVVLGVFSTLVTAVLSVGGVWAGLRLWAATHPWSYLQYFAAPVLPLVIIVACAIAATLVAALLPATRLGRLDIVGVMRGQTVSPPLNKILPAAGIVLAVIGAVGIIWAVRTQQREIPVIVAGMLLVIGPMMTVPALLVLAGRLASPLPVAARMATRDAARHRSRATPTVGAILGGAAALAIFSIALASDTEQSARNYTPSLPSGIGMVQYYGGNGLDASTVQTQVDRFGDGDVVTAEMGQVGTAEGPYAAADPSAPVAVVAVTPSSCTDDQAIGADLAGPTGPDASAEPTCAVLGGLAQSNVNGITVVPMADIPGFFDLDDAHLATLRDGGMVAMVPQLGKSAEVLRGSVTYDPTTYVPQLEPGVERVPITIAQLPRTRDNIGALGPNAGALISTETAAALKLPTYTDGSLLRSTSGGISDEVETGLSETLGENSYVYVERGFEREDALVMGILFGGFALLLIIVTLISTALALAEQQSDMGTFAAVGATRGTRRRLAASQSVVVALIGSVLGIAVGIFPGIALTYPLTSESYDPFTGMGSYQDPVLVIPWLPLVAVVIGVPLVAGLLSAAAVRKAPRVTRRAE